VREVPLDVAMSMEWARASTLLRVVFAEVRPRSRERVGVVAADESPADLLARVAAAVKVPLRASDAAELLAEGERVGLWSVRERLVDGARWRFLVVAALPPSVVRARRDAEEAERGARGGKSDRQRQREHREAARGPAPVVALPGTEVPAGWSQSAESPTAPSDPPAQGGEGGQVFDRNVTAPSRLSEEISRDEPARGTGGPPSLSGTPSGVPREGGGGPAPVAPASTSAAGGAAPMVLSPPPGPVAPAVDAAAWAAALGAAAGDDKPARRAALEALGRGVVATLAAKVGREVFDGRAATAEELRGLGAVMAREGVDRGKLLEVRGWLGAESHTNGKVRSDARKAFLWDEGVRLQRAPITVALLLGKRVEGEHRGSGWRAAAKASGAWAAKVAAAGVALTFADDGPGPVRAGEAAAVAPAAGGAAHG